MRGKREEKERKKNGKIRDIIHNRETELVCYPSFSLLPYISYAKGAEPYRVSLFLYAKNKGQI